MKRFTVTLLAMIALAATLAGAQAQTSDCYFNDRRMHAYDERTNTLTVFGKSAIPDLEKINCPAPWNDYRDRMKRLLVIDSVTAIGNYAFNGYPALEYVSITESVRRIGCFAFTDCPALRTVNVERSIPPTVNDSAFFNVSLSAVRLIVPRGSRAAYALAPVWKEFKQISETATDIVLSGTKVYVTEGRLHLSLPASNDVQIYSISGALVRTFTAPAGDTSVALPSGIYLVRIGTQTEKVTVE